MSGNLTVLGVAAQQIHKDSHEDDFVESEIYTPSRYEVRSFIRARDKFRQYQVCHYRNDNSNCNEYKLTLPQKMAYASGLKWLPEADVRDRLKEDVADGLEIGTEDFPKGWLLTWDVIFGAGVGIFMPEENMGDGTSVIHFGTGFSYNNMIGLEAFVELMYPGYYTGRVIEEDSEGQLWNRLGNEESLHLGLKALVHMFSAGVRYQTVQNGVLASAGLEIPMYSYLSRHSADDDDPRMRVFKLSMEGVSNFQNLHGAMITISVVDQKPIASSTPAK